MSTDVEFEWDEDNVEHLARHGISSDEAEEALLGRTVGRRGGTRAPDLFGYSAARRLVGTSFSSTSLSRTS